MKQYWQRGGRLLAVALVALVGAAQAEDIELFMMDPSVVADRPNVLLVIDNQSNWGQNERWYLRDAAGSLIKDADGNPIQVSGSKQQMIYEALDYLLLESSDLLNRGVNLGIMNISSHNHRGGRVVAHVQRLDEAARQPGGRLHDVVRAMDPAGGHELPAESSNWWTSSNSDYGMLLHEVFLYLRGDEPWSGRVDGRDLAALGGSGPYNSPIADTPCASNYVIFIATGHPQNDHSSRARDRLAAFGGSTSTISLNPSNYEASWADEWARFLASARAEPQVRTFVVDVANPDAQKNQPYRATRAFWESVGRWGRYTLAWQKEGIADALQDAFDQMVAANSVFASSALPVSVNVRGTHLNQVYMGVFRPDPEKRPRWMGNLKAYQLGRNAATGELYLADADRERADSSITGFIREGARSFWSQESSFWDADYFDMELYRHPSDAPDGDVVEKGGVAQQLRNNWSTRQLLTCGNACSGALVPLSTTSSSLEAAEIEWLKGSDNIDNETGSLTAVRASIHGDVLHSRPAVLNYRNDEDIVVFYGANDGSLRAVRGGLGGNGGQELWSFVAPEFFPRIGNLYRNEPIDSRTGKPYFMDGGIGRHIETNGSGEIAQAWIFPSMRRGGRVLYGFDVTDYANPRILWRLDHTKAGFEELGQTWSEPRTIRTPARNGDPLLVFGAGYDPGFEDALPRSGSASMGRGIFIVDAGTGALVWSAGPDQGMTYSVPSEITAISRDPQHRRDGIVDRLYVGDTGGNVWRVDLNSESTADWRVHKLASLGSDQKFLFPPDVVYDANGGYDAILLGSGDREKPHDTSVANAFYMLKDAHPAAGQEPWEIAEALDPIVPAELYDATDNLIQEGADKQAELEELHSQRGWLIRFRGGEKTVGSALTLDGTTFFSTHQPQAAAAGACVSNLGIARNYALSFRDATATREQDGREGLTKEDRSAEIPGGGFLPSPVAVLVEIDGELREAVLRGTQVDEGGRLQLNRRVRTYWHREID